MPFCGKCQNQRGSPLSRGFLVEIRAKQRYNVNNYAASLDWLCLGWTCWPKRESIECTFCGIAVRKGGVRNGHSTVWTQSKGVSGGGENAGTPRQGNRGISQRHRQKRDYFQAGERTFPYSTRQMRKLSERVTVRTVVHLAQWRCFLQPDWTAARKLLSLQMEKSGKLAQPKQEGAWS